MTDLGALLRKFRISAFRLETRDRYSVPQEAEWFAEWQRTGTLPELTPENDSWLKLVAEATRAGKQMQRVHLVTPPLTDYLRFEFATQVPSVECGENCRVAELEQDPALLQCSQDFWVFDSSTVVVLEYDEAGRFLEARQDLDVAEYLRQRDLVMAQSISLKEYLAKL
jgi:hypothetical protein